MTHIVHPYSHRLGIIRGWKSRWFGNKNNFKSNLRGDINLRIFLDKKLQGMYVAQVEIERSQKEFRIVIHTSRPGMIIGRSGDGIEKLRKDILKFSSKQKIEIPNNFKLDILEVASPEASATIVAIMVVEQLEKRIPFRRAMKTTLDKVMANRDVLGARILLSGRLGGAEMARKDQMRKGSIPLQTLRADVDFAKGRAHMAYGTIGVKVWIYRGMKYQKDAHLKGFSSINEELKINN